jgi:hypothetical protein
MRCTAENCRTLAIVARKEWSLGSAQASAWRTMRPTLGGGVFCAVAPTISSPSFECPFKSLDVTCIKYDSA